MKKQVWVLLLTIVVFLCMPLMVSALGLDVSVQAGGGAALGTTDSDLKSGKLRWSIDAGLAVDFYGLDLGALSLGLSTGLDYAMLNYYGVTEIPIAYGPVGDRVGEPRYNYLFIPVAFVGKAELRGGRALTARIGGFAAYFLGGKTDVTYDTEIPGTFDNGEYDLDDTNTEQWMYGLRAYMGVTVFQKDKLSVSPGIQFDLGLTDSTVDIAAFPPDVSKDTFWALIVNVALKYSAF